MRMKNFSWQKILKEALILSAIWWTVHFAGAAFGWWDWGLTW